MGVLHDRALANARRALALQSCSNRANGASSEGTADDHTERIQPELALEQAQFFETLQACVDRLPARTGRVFMMREWLEREVDEICAELGITANNCGVMLYRARMQLRECLEQRWFEGRP